MDPLAPLRYTTSLLANTTDISLPTQIPAIASLFYTSPLLDCALGPTAAQPRRKQEDAAVTANKFKTQVSSMLQSKSPQIRWCGAVLVKCSVESSFQALIAWGPVWTRLLVPLVSRPEPTAVHTMAIRTLTRIFTDLTAGKPNLSREIVTPHIPTVFTGLLNLITTSMDDSEPEVLATSLEALRDLLRAHPVTARPFSARIRTVALRLLLSESRNDINQLGRELFVTLHLCASSSSRGPSIANMENLRGGKANLSALEWTGSFTTVIDETHDALDRLLEPIVEEYGNSRSSKLAQKHARIGEEETTTKLGLKEWNGMADGLKRLHLLIRLLQAFFSSPTSTQVHVHFGRVIELVTRILAVSASSQPNNAIETSEREALLSVFPEVQAEIVGLLDCAVRRFRNSLTAFIPTILGQIAYLFADQLWSASVKTAVYIVLASLLSVFGPGLGKESTTSIYAILSTATSDLLPSRLPDTIQKPVGKKKNTKTHSVVHADSFLTQTSDVFRLPGIVAAASLLLSTAMSRVSATYIPSELRTKMDRAAVVCGNEKALLAGVMFPPPKAKASLISHLVGASNSLEVEALTRPRIPVVWTGSRRRVEDEDEEEEAQDEPMDASGIDVNASWKDDHQDEGNANKRIRLDSKVNETYDVFQPSVFLQPTASKSDHLETPTVPAPAISPIKLPSIPTVPPTLGHGLSATNFSTSSTIDTSLTPSNVEAMAGISPVKTLLSSAAEAEYQEGTDLTRSNFTQEQVAAAGETIIRETMGKDSEVRRLGQEDVSGIESDDMEIPEIVMEDSSEDEDD